MNGPAGGKFWCPWTMGISPHFKKSMPKHNRYSLRLMDTTCHKLGLKRPEFISACFFLLFGIAVRTHSYLAGISLWNDEAAMAGNLISKSISDLFGPLDVGQIAPVGFCLVEKLSLLLLGNHELSLRLIPFAAGVAVLPLAFLFALRTVGSFCAVLCLAQLAVIPEAIYQANNLKPYSVELAVALGLMLPAWRDGSVKCSRKPLLWLGFWGSIALWFSFSALFILLGIGAVLMIQCAVRRNWRGVILFSIVSVFWGFSFWLQYHLLQTKSHDPYLLIFWDKYFMPFPPFGPGDLEFFPDVLMRVFKAPLWTLGARGSALFFLIGCVLVWRKNRSLLALLLLPLMLNLLTSGFHKYPFGERLLLYGVVNLYIPIAVFLEWLWRQKWRFVRFKYAAIVLIILNLAKPMVMAAGSLVKPVRIEEMKPVVAHVAEHLKPGDKVFVHHHAVHTFFYYRQRFGVDPANTRVSRAITPQTLHEIGENINSLNGRVWLVFGHAKIIGEVNYEKAFLRAAEQRGRLMDQCIREGASAYLFDFPASGTKSPVQ